MESGSCGIFMDFSIGRMSFVRLPSIPFELAADFHNRRYWPRGLLVETIAGARYGLKGPCVGMNSVLRHEAMSPHQLLRFRSQDRLSIASTYSYLQFSSSSKTGTRPKLVEPCVRFEAGIEDAKRYLRS